jgi:hypothetical protein
MLFVQHSNHEYVISPNSESFHRARFLVSRYQDREIPSPEQLRTSAKQTTAVVRATVEALVRHNNQITGRELEVLYQLCQDSSDGLSVDEKRERVRELDLPQSDTEQIVQRIDQSVGSVGTAPQDPQLVVDINKQTNVARELRDCFERIVENYDSESELLETVDDLVNLDLYGVQSDLISPILHHLAPEVFPVISRQSKRSVNLLFGEDTSLNLADYLDERERYLNLRDQFDLEPQFRDLDCFLHWAQSSDNEWTEVLREGVDRAVWQAQPGHAKYSVPEELWPIWRTRGIISAGWIGDVDETSDELSGWAANFVKNMSPGDIVICKSGVYKLLGLGVISTESYEYVGGTDEEIPVHRPDKSKVHESIRQVEWVLTRDFDNPIHIGDWDISKRFGSQWIAGYYTFEELRWHLSQKRRDEVLSDLRSLESRSLAYALDRDPGTSTAGHGDERGLEDSHSGEDDSVTEIPDKPGRAKEIRRQLEAKNQVVFHGPPGTGKTYQAQRFAEWWVYEQTGGHPREEQVESVTFHPSFAYEDFVEGLTAEATDTGDVEYQVEDGILKRVADNARRAHERAVESGATDGPANVPPYVLVIDEINRGNLAQIFGETITLLEADKRGSYEVSLAHSDASFTLPPNLYVVGTMNTADRSIALVDAALRRRFRFLPFEPDYGSLREHHGFDGPGELVEAVTAGEDGVRTLLGLSILAVEQLNERIVGAPDLSKGQQIGHSYLWDAESVLDIVDTWQYDILPLLEEYYFGQFDRIRRQLFDGTGEELVDWERERIREFDDEDLAAFLERFVDIDGVVNYSPSRSTDELESGARDHSPEFPRFLESVGAALIDEIGGTLQADSLRDVHATDHFDRLSLVFHSRHPAHPDGDSVRYRMLVRPHLDPPRIETNLAISDEQLRTQFADDIRQRIEESGLPAEGVNPNQVLSTVHLRWETDKIDGDPYEVDGDELRTAFGEDLVEEAKAGFVDLVETFHPLFVEATIEPIEQ